MFGKWENYRKKKEFGDLYRSNYIVIKSCLCKDDINLTCAVIN